MKAGRELDALIAGKVMGWKHRGPHPLFGTEVWASDKGDNLLPHFSTDIAAAWTVVDKLREEWIVTAEIDSTQCVIGLGHNYASTPEELRASAATAPHAICLAALKAVGHE